MIPLHRQVGVFAADKSDEIIKTVECDNRQLENNIAMLESQYSSLNQQLDEMTKTAAERHV